MLEEILEADLALHDGLEALDALVLDLVPLGVVPEALVERGWLPDGPTGLPEELAIASLLYNHICNEAEVINYC